MTKDRINIDNISETFNKNQFKRQPGPNMTHFKIDDDEIVSATYMTSYPIKKNNKIIEKIDFEHFKKKNFRNFSNSRTFSLSEGQNA